MTIRPWDLLPWQHPIWVASNPQNPTASASPTLLFRIKGRGFHLYMLCQGTQPCGWGRSLLGFTQKISQLQQVCKYEWGMKNNPLCKWISELNSNSCFSLLPLIYVKRTEMVPLRKSSQILALVPTPWVQLRHLRHNQLLATLGQDNTSTHTNSIDNKNLQNNKTTTVPHHK